MSSELDTTKTKAKHDSETRPSEPEHPPARPFGQHATTQIGQVFAQLRHLTERLPLNLPPRDTNGQHATAAPERIRMLVQAFGDPQHPQHAGAVDEIVEIGRPAVPSLIEALRSPTSWLVAYRAAEALGGIADGRAVSQLIQALRHPNSNVRWSAIRALAHIGDLRAVLELRRVALEDHGRTSWGESVAATAQSTLDHLRTRSVWGHTVELVKTAITSVLMILALILAFSAATTLRTELLNIGLIDPNNPVIPNVVPPEAPAGPLSEEDAALAALPVAEATATPTPDLPTPTPAPELFFGTVLQSSNVRPAPSTQNQPVGQLFDGDEVELVGRTVSGDWYMVRLRDSSSGNSTITNPNGSGLGWINESLLDIPPDALVPVQEGNPAALDAAPLDAAPPTPSPTPDTP